MYKVISAEKKLEYILFCRFIKVPFIILLFEIPCILLGSIKDNMHLVSTIFLKFLQVRNYTISSVKQNEELTETIIFYDKLQSS